MSNIWGLLLQGDSGSGLVVLTNSPAPVLVGVVSYGVAECGAENKAGVYARVQLFTSWIRESMKLNSVPDVVSWLSSPRGIPSADQCFAGQLIRLYCTWLLVLACSWTVYQKQKADWAIHVAFHQLITFFAGQMITDQTVRHVTTSTEQSIFIVYGHFIYSSCLCRYHLLNMIRQSMQCLCSVRNCQRGFRSIWLMTLLQSSMWRKVSSHRGKWSNIHHIEQSNSVII